MKLAELSKSNCYLLISARFMADVVKIHETISLPHRREVVWPILSRTDWVNRAIGLPPVKYVIKPRPEGGSEVTARAKAYGISLQWTEYPFEWTEPKFYQVRRVFHSGPLVQAVLGVRLNGTPDGCTMEMFGDFTPRNALGAFVAKRLLGPKVIARPAHIDPGHQRKCHGPARGGDAEIADGDGEPGNGA